LAPYAPSPNFTLLPKRFNPSFGGLIRNTKDLLFLRINYHNTKKHDLSSFMEIFYKRNGGVWTKGTSDTAFAQNISA
jgi:hypothetical protein